MHRYWFRPKKYGYGATPTTWEGWASIAVVAGLAYALASVLIIVPHSHGHPDIWRIVLYVAALALLLIGFAFFTKAKTDGKWHWRWGDGTGRAGR